MKMKRPSSFVYGVSLYLDRFHKEIKHQSDVDKSKKLVEELFEICRREEDGGVGMIESLCEWLSGRMIENCEGSVDVNEKRLNNLK